MRAVLAVCVLVAVGCTGPIGQPAARATPQKLASGGVVEYPVPDPIAPGASCFGCGQASLGGIVAGPDGNIWFLDSGHYKVGRLTAVGAVTEFNLPANVGGPVGITVGPDGNLWITTAALGQGRPDWILRMSFDGKVTPFQAGVGDGVSGTSPQRITTGPDGNLWFTEAFSNRIGRMTPAGTLTEFPLPMARSNPRAIVAGPDGNLWFTEASWSQPVIGRITPAGSVTEYRLDVPADVYPSEMVVGPDHNLWFTAPQGKFPQPSIGRITPAGVVAFFALPSRGAASDLASGPDGNIWFTDPSGNTIGRLSPTGAARLFALPRRNSQPAQVTAGHDGRLWFTEGSRVASIGTTVPEVTLDAHVMTFGAGSATPHSVTVTNTGDADLAITGVALAGADQGAFKLTSDDCIRHRVAVHASCHISVAFASGSDPGVHAAQLTITDNATGNPQVVSLVAQLPDCKLPVFTNTKSTTQGGFLNVRDGTVSLDPNGGFVAGDLLSHSVATPVLQGQVPAYYDRAAGRWVPTGVGAMSPDGRRYAYMDYRRPFDFQLHAVDVATGHDRLVAIPNGSWSVVGFTSDGVYVHQSYEGIGPGLWLVNPDTGAMRQLFSDAAVDIVSGQVAWLEMRDNTDPLPEPPGIGGANNEIRGRDLKTGVTTRWFYRSGSGVRVQAAANGTIIVGGYDGAGTYLWALSAPGQAAPITVPGSEDAVPWMGGLVADSNGWWLGSLDGVYLWTSRTGAILVSESLAAPAGTCG
ncbi:MAG: hypothetical protein AUJ02_09970 [Chloroflexi bacterium 13_1_40CM_3_65_12]|nr:MAG: hypothetical protein AUH40_05465 [Chloroflexi bacterium 13_1_40CM_65_17]OLC67702.1 MAG: hypothetical protein AUH69_03355 [Actinobacteria bacterium 13_1_40CM_4_65_12]OLD23680.1 MAG: hypothetical protein AUJ02_09970 [Chloroflexi bacterium 13_1_40CM_3_65_12]OLD50447.1 MAG: hypothetical protein AUI42_03170 [Actinobacteria bacterium 13_1_40CM_2_65_8]